MRPASELLNLLKGRRVTPFGSEPSKEVGLLRLELTRSDDARIAEFAELPQEIHDLL